MLILMNLHFDVKKKLQNQERTLISVVGHVIAQKRWHILILTGTLWGSVFHSLVLLLFLLETSEVLFCFYCFDRPYISNDNRYLATVGIQCTIKVHVAVPYTIDLEIDRVERIDLTRLKIDRLHRLASHCLFEHSNSRFESICLVKKLAF